MKKNEFEKEIISYFDDEEIPQLNEEEKNKLKNQITENKKCKPRILYVKFISLVACLLIMIITPSIVLPLALKPSLRFYGDIELERVKLDQTETEELFLNSFPKYYFIFEECIIKSIFGYYSPDKNKKLLAVNITFAKNSIPYTDSELCLVKEKNFIYSHHKKFTDNAEIIKQNDYTLYKSFLETISGTHLLALFEYKNYSLYLTLKKIDNNFFEKFC